MSFDKEKLLAYALGELGPQESRHIEAFLQTDPEAARFVRDQQQLAGKLSADLHKEKIPSGQGLAGLERALGRKQGAKSARNPAKLGWMEASVGLLLVLAAIIYWRKPLTGIFERPAQQAEGNLDFYETNFASLSGKGEPEGGKALSAMQVKNALADWKERPREEESVGECTFPLPAPSRAEAGLTKMAGEQKAWFYLLNDGKTQLRLIMDGSDCRLSLEVRANLSAEEQGEVEEDLRGLEGEMGAGVERRR